MTAGSRDDKDETVSIRWRSMSPSGGLPHLVRRVERVAPDAGRWQGRSVPAVSKADGEPAGRPWRYLPLALLVTASVTVAPVALVALLVPPGGAVSAAMAAVTAVAASVAIAGVEAAIWKCFRHARDVVFADLMLWGLARRISAERRLTRLQELHEAIAGTGSPPSIALLEELSARLEARDAYTSGHHRRVARLAERTARAMGLDRGEIARIRMAAAVHDIGKLHTPRAVLNKPGRLTEGELEVMRSHAIDGAAIVAELGDGSVTAMVRHHHERVDGTGYPDRLTSSEIPLGARIIAVADTFDAITSSRAYRSAATHRQALHAISASAGSQLDSAVVDAFLSCYSARRLAALSVFAAVVPGRIYAALQAASSSLGGGAVGSFGSLGALASVLPAIGAAGVLSVSSGVHQHDAGASSLLAHQRPAVRRSVPTTAGASGSSRASASGGGSGADDRSRHTGDPSRHHHGRAPGSDGRRPGTGGEQAPTDATGTGRSEASSGGATMVSSSATTTAGTTSQGTIPGGPNGSDGGVSGGESTNAGSAGSGPSETSTPAAGTVPQLAKAVAPAAARTVSELAETAGEAVASTVAPAAQATTGTADEAVASALQALAKATSEPLSQTAEALSSTTGAL
jgi:HD-GYP domain-containing protein (c-di-GMP phosphodiesterase class II)